MKYWKRCLACILIICIIAVGSIFSIGYVRYHNIIQEKPLNEIVEELRQSVDYMPLDEVDKDFLDAIVAVEDPTFYTHQGVVLSNIIEAFYTNIKEKDLVMGGSTITQQLSKNIYLDQRKTFQRKAAELFFVHDIESTLSKDEILELYINIIYFGDGYYGIKQACKGYFNTAPNHITIAQATLLAGLPQAPAIYQLSDGMKLAKQRQKEVLDAMQIQNMISHNEYDEIYNQPV